MMVTVLVLLGCIALLGAWRSGGLEGDTADSGPVPPPPGMGSTVPASSTP